MSDCLIVNIPHHDIQYYGVLKKWKLSDNIKLWSNDIENEDRWIVVQIDRYIDRYIYIKIDIYTRMLFWCTFSASLGLNNSKIRLRSNLSLGLIYGLSFEPKLKLLNRGLWILWSQNSLTQNFRKEQIKCRFLNVM